MSANNTIKTNAPIKNLAVKGYVKGMTLANHTYETACRLIDATPAIWDKASQAANAELDQIFAELGI